MTPTKEIIDLFKSTPGAISVCEGIALFDIALNTPREGIGVCLGSHAGKDSIMSSAGLSLIGHTHYVLVDPVYDLKNERAWSQTCQGDASKMPWGYVNEPDFKEKVSDRIQLASGGKIIPLLMGEASMDALPKIVKEFGHISFCMIDSNDHDLPLLEEETNFLRANMIVGGIIVIHDMGNYSPPVKIHKALVDSGQFISVEIDWNKIISAVKSLGGETGNNSWHCPQTDFPCFLGAAIKVS